METTLSIITIAFAAFCIGLIMRIVKYRERWALWTAVVLLVAYLGLFWWIRSH